MMIHSVNPSTGKLIKEYHPHTNEDVLSIIDKVSTEYTKWKTLTLKERSNVIVDIADALGNNIEEHAKMISPCKNTSELCY